MQGDLNMRYRVHNDISWSERLGCYFDHYFRTKKEAIAYAETIGHNPVIERKITCDVWVRCN